MALYKTATFVITVFVILLHGLEISSIRCYHCENCNKTNIKIVACAISNSTITTTPSASTNSPSSSSISNTSSTSPVSNQSSTMSRPALTTSSTSTSSSTQSNPNRENERTNDIKLKRSVGFQKSIEDFKDNVCVCDDEICNCAERAISLTNITFACATDTYTGDNGVKIINKGCAMDLHNNTNTCLLSGYTSKCKTCSKDLCNFATPLSASTILLLTAIISVFKSF